MTSAVTGFISRLVGFLSSAWGTIRSWTTAAWGRSGDHRRVPGRAITSGRRARAMPFAVPNGPPRPYVIWSGLWGGVRATVGGARTAVRHARKRWRRRHSATWCPAGVGGARRLHDTGELCAPSGIVCGMESDPSRRRQP